MFCCTAPVEYFEYGLWIPKDELLVKAPGFSKTSESGSLKSRSVIEPPKKEKKEKQEKKEKEEKPKGPPPIPPEKQAFLDQYGPSASASKIAEKARTERFAPSMSDVNKLHQQFGDQVTYEDYIEFKKQITHAEDADREFLIGFFKAYDSKGDGTLSHQQVKNLLMNYGEPLTEEETESILSELDATGKEINYYDLVAKLMES